MTEIEIYTRPFCGYCVMAKRTLNNKGVTFTEYNINQESEKRHEMLSRSNGGRTVPQIFIDGEYIGGCMELLSLDSQGGLDPMIFERVTNG